MSAQIFENYAARRKFNEIYSMLKPDIRDRFAARVRNAADEKVNSLDDNITEFYLNENDVLQCLKDVESV